MTWCLVLFAAQQDFVAMGWRSVERSEFDVAETLFAMALAREPSNAEAHAGLGTAFARQGAYAMALDELEKAAELGSEYPHLRLELGRARVLLRDPERALADLSAYHSRFPDSWQADELLGMTYFALGSDAEAEAHLRQAYDGSGPNTAMYLYHLGVVAGRLGRGDESRAYADTLRRRFPESEYARGLGDRRPRNSTERNIWAAARERRHAERSWYAYGTVEGGYDTNPLSIGEEAIVPADLAGRDSFTFGSTIGAGWRALWTEFDSVVVDGRYTGLWRDELSAFDQDLYAVSVEGEHWLTRAVGIGGSGSYSHLAVGGEDTVSSWSLGAHGFWAQEAWTRTALRYSFASSEYFIDTLPNVSDLDSKTHSFSAAQEMFVPGTDLYLGFGAHASIVDTEGRDFNATYRGGFIRAAHPVIWKIRAIGSLSYVNGDFDEPNSRSTTGRSRRDDRLTVSLRVQRPLCDYATMFLGVSWTDNTSNLGAFDYDRNQYALGIDFRY